MTDILSGEYLEEEERRQERETSGENDDTGGHVDRPNRNPGSEGGWRARRESRRKAESRLLEVEESISAGTIIGGSLLFEFVVLLLAWWVFVRRDY